MFKKTMTYVDYNGNERTEDFFFDLSEAEIVDKELTTEGGVGELIKKMINTSDYQGLVLLFKEFVLLCYGEKSADGRYFLKEDERGYKLANKFKQTRAYSDLFMQLASDDIAAVEFIKGVLPSAMAKEFNNTMSKDMSIDEIKKLINGEENAENNSASNRTV